MKFKTTKKDIMRNYYCIKVGYCELQRLLSCVAPTAYTCGTYGWNADVYTFEDSNTAIITGYRPFGEFSADYDLCRKYEEKAHLTDYDLNYEAKRERLAGLIEDFIHEAIHTERKGA